jgi:REP element-mobilizing transposase RayT
VHIRDRGRLPHWEKDSGLYFLTFSLADSLPKPVLAKLVERRRTLAAAKQAGARLSSAQETLFAELSPRRLEAYMDRGSGCCALADPRIAGAMTAALRFHNGRRYRLLSWCIMPNHIHIVTRFFPGSDLASVVKSWKHFSARAANHALGKNGRFWRREYYDRLIRDEQELQRVMRYVLDNPAKAGLKNWPWVWSAE